MGKKGPKIGQTLIGIAPSRSSIEITTSFSIALRNKKLKKKVIKLFFYTHL